MVDWKVDMPRVARELGALAIGRLTTPGWHAVGGVAGLGLQVAPTGARSWVLRHVIAGKRREIGLGGYPTVLPAQAREKARSARQTASEGVDPVLAKKAAQSAIQRASAKAVTFKKLAEQYITAHESGWRNAKHGAQWTNTLTQYAYPFIGSMLVADIDTPAVLRVLESEPEKGKGTLWATRTETASRLRGRIEVEWEGGTFEFAAGDIVYWPNNRWYRTRVISEEPAEVFYVMSPPPTSIWSLGQQVTPTGKPVDESK